MPVSSNDVATQTSGQFHRLNTALTNAEVEQLFDEVSKAAAGPTEAREIRIESMLGKTRYWTSFLCFPIEGPPPFLPNSILRERRFAFLLTIELACAGKWFLGVFKSNINGLEEGFEGLCKPIPRRGFTRAFGGQAIYEKLSLRRMTVSQHELRSSSYEAVNLEISLPSLAITRSVPRRLRLHHERHGTISITPGTSRIHKSGPRSNTAGLARLVRDVAHQTERATSNEFLDAFPNSIEFETKPKTLAPTGVLFDWWPLLAVRELRRVTGKGKTVPVTSEFLLRLLGGVLLTKRHGNEWKLLTETGIKVGQLRSTERGYAISELLKQKIKIVEDATDTQRHLTTWLREQQAFQIAFSSPEYFYTAGHLYKRAGFDREVELVRSILRPHAGLTAVTSEKGKPEPSSLVDAEFPISSIFRFVEDTLYVPRQFLWCSDLGDEWADYVGLQQGGIVFAHCKHGKRTLGATPYQEVIGQALKNLGRVQGTPEVFERKIQAAAATDTWGHTSIVRLRDGVAWNDFETVFVQRLRDPNVPREVHLVVSMLSLAAYDAAAAASKKKANFIQLVWLLATFMSSTREHGAKPVIVCAP